MQFKVKTIGRSCDGCTKCCEGWLSGEAYGYKFSPGLKCAFLNKGCSIYPNHPVDPCKLFECQWKSNRSLPEWLKPDKVGAIIMKRQLDIFEYFMVVPAANIAKQVYDWADSFYRQSIKNHVIIRKDKEFKIYSNHGHFRELADSKFNKGG